MTDNIQDIKNVPELRFPEFEGEWVCKKFSSLYSFKPTNSFSREKLNYEEGCVKNIHYGDIHTKFKTFFDVSEEHVPFVNEDVNLSRISEDCYVQEGDLIIADASEDYADIGKTIEVLKLSGEKVLAGLHTLLARRESNEMAFGFSGALMKTPKVRLDFKQIAQGTKVLGISNKRVADIILNTPNLPEQEKIANFLMQVDKRIENLNKKKEKLEEYKKGVMQKIFSQEIRFKDEDGNDYPSWEEKRLGDVVSFLRGNNLSKMDLVKNGVNKCIHYGELFTTYKEVIKNIQSSTNIVNGVRSIKGDILMPSSDVTPLGLATSSCILSDNVILGGDINVLRPKINVDSVYFWS